MGLVTAFGVVLRMLARERGDTRAALPECPASRKPRSARFMLASLLAPVVIGHAAHAQPEATREPAAPAEDEKGSAVRAQINLDAATAYFYHGIIQEDSGLILQPAAKVTLNVFQNERIMLDLFAGTWNTFHGQKTGASTQGDFTEYWYESDLLAGATVTMGKFSVTGQYVLLTSPSDAYETVQEFDLTLAYDDTELLKKFALHPYATVGVECGADASDGANSDAGVYLELGVAPGFSFDVSETPVAISFPVSVGLSLKDYYQDAAGDDDTFGFAQVGAKASIPLPFGGRYGAWTLNAGVHGLFLGDHTSDYNSGDGFEVIGTVGLQVNF
ncbi:hypothetical protein PHYC_00339 [Phycisphaerales bacterium]|nr:hypothetical protein PHYC_00339 [Phycisphaerales bacterium]